MSTPEFKPTARIPITGHGVILIAKDDALIAVTIVERGGNLIEMQLNDHESEQIRAALEAVEAMH